MASSDNDNGRMLSLLEALFNGQKRTLGLVEAAIEKFSGVETEISKLNRKTNVVHDAALHRHGEVMIKFDGSDAKFSVVEAEISELSGKINIVHDAALHRHGEVMNKFDSIDAKFSVVEAEVSKLNREMTVVREAALRQHVEIMLRFDAVAARLEETERLLDDRSLDIKRTQIELVAQYNEILTALQLSTNASKDVQDLDERLSELERRMQA